jgi:hypothetical protein
VRVLLDENFPLKLLRVLREDGIDADHVITLGWRGAPDSYVRQHLADPELLFLTHDEDYLFGPSVTATTVVSRVRQSRRLDERVALWLAAIRDLFATPRPDTLFELADDGRLLPWRDVGSSRRR